MKKTLTIILMFAVVMAACLGVAELVEWLRPAEETVAEIVEEPVVVANVMDVESATVIELTDGGAVITGIGADATEEGVKIAYPGTYRIRGTMTDGQIIVDCEDFHGGIYILLDGADIACSTGPAIYVKQSEKTVLHLVEGTVNRLQDGVGYTITEKQEVSTGGAVYCDDDLFIEGTGALTVVGNNADGIRSKDGLTISAGTVTVTAADDGVQGSDYVDILGGSLAVTAAGDGIASTKGDITLSGGSVAVAADGDGISSAAAANLLGGSHSITTYGGAEYYNDMALLGLSAKGVKAQNVTVSGGTYVMNTADDAMHGDENLTISGGELFVRSGDDAISAAQTLAIQGGRLVIETSYEGLEAANVTVSDGLVSIYAENDGVDAIGGFTMTGGAMTIEAPQCVSTDELFQVQSGVLYLSVTGEDTALKFGEGAVTGGTLIVTGIGSLSEFQSGGVLPSSLLFVLPGELGAGAQVGLWDASGAQLLSCTTVQPAGMILVASGAMGLGQEYSLTAGEWSMTAVLGEENTIVQ